MAPKRDILIDVRRLIWRTWVGGTPTGVDHVCLAYLQHYAPRAQAVVGRGRLRKILTPEHSDRIFALLLRGGTQFRRKVTLLGAEAIAKGWSQPSRGLGRLYLNVGHTGLEQASLVADFDVRPIYMIHDLIPITHPEYCRAGEKERHAARIVTAVKTGRGIIANSNETSSAIDALAVRYGYTAPLKIAALLGTRMIHEPAPSAAPLDRPYFLMLGTIEGRKNHILILNIWRDLVESCGDRAPMLVIIGKRGWESEQVVDLLERCGTLKGHVIEIPQGSDTDVARYFRHACALLFPSFAEGYGMPLIEALSVGLPVIASDLAVFRELAGDIPDYFSPIDGLGWRAAIEAYTPQNSPQRQRQVERMANFQPPTWDNHFQIVDHWLQTIVQGAWHPHPTGSSPSSRNHRRP